MTRLAATLACAALLGAPPLVGQNDSLTVRETVRPCAKVRQRPDPDAGSKACLAPGTRVVGIGVVPFWRKVRLSDGRTGWVAKQALAEAPAGTVGVARSGAADSAPAIPAAADDRWLEVHVVDVGQGDGIWIHTADDGIPGNGVFEGRNIIIDGGPDASDGRNELLHYLQRQAPDGAFIDALIVTHPHDDHYPGAQAILRHYQVRDYYDPGYPSSSSKYLSFRAVVAAERADGRAIVQHIGRAHFGQPDWGRELQVQFLYAYDSTADLGSGNTKVNNASIVLRIGYGTQSFLFMGDAEGKERAAAPDAARYVERWLLDSVGPGLKSTVLKIAHHGSETSSTLPFIRAVNPRVVVVASGRRQYGPRFLPDASTLRRYCDHDPAIRIYRTDENDAAEHRTTANDADGDHVVLRTNGTVLLVDAFSAGTPVTPTACEAN
jgi:competence protein ComEC